ncbi:MAG: hypothetical protein FWC40_01425 [Proteobacteria bacterium]|nr:hypothetical protein [Pseudomonadota bacterium]
MTLRFKPHLPEETPQWLEDLLEVMVSPYPNYRVKDLNRLVRAIRTIGGVGLEGHSMSMDEAGKLGSMESMKYQYLIPTHPLFMSFFFIHGAIFCLLFMVMLAKSPYLSSAVLTFICLGVYILVTFGAFIMLGMAIEMKGQKSWWIS